MATPESSEHDADRGVAYRIVRAMFVVLFFWMFWKFGGFLLNALVGRLYKAGAESDAYFFAAQAVVYGLIFSRALKILIPAFTPLFIEERNRHGERAAWDFASTVLNLALVACAAMMLMVYLYAAPITATLVPGFDPEARALGIRLLKWIMPGAALMVLFLPMRAVLNSYKVFGYPAAAEATQKLAWAVGLFVAYRYLHMGIMAVALGFLVGSAGMMAVTLFGLRRRAGLYRPGFPCARAGRLLKEALICAGFLGATLAGLKALGGLVPEGWPYRDIARLTVVLAAVTGFTGQLWLRSKGRVGVMGRFAALAAPLIVGTAFAAYRDLVTFYFQSFTARGVFSDIEYARRIAFVPTTMVAYALSVAMFPYLCELASRAARRGGTQEELAGVVTKALRMLALGFVPLTVMTIILADPVTRLVLDRGDWAAVHLHYTALALALLSLGLTMYAWEFVIMQAYFSLQRMWTPTLMGIVATLFQFAFLAVPIYALGYGYPVHLFFLTALAYPVSRYFKNLLLLGILRRRLPVLPARRSLVFAGKLVLLSAAVGVATWAAHAWVKGALPFERHRERKVVVDNFETTPDTWFSLNASEIHIVEAPGEGHGLAVMMRYERGGRTRCSLYRQFGTIRVRAGMRLSFALRSERPMAGVAVEIERGGRKTRVLEERFESPEDQPAARWRTFSFTLDTGEPITRIHWLEPDSTLDTPNTLYLDDVALGDAGAAEWIEDFDRNGWSPAGRQGREAGSALRIVQLRPDEGAPRCALRVAAGVRKALGAHDLSGTERLRCRLMSPAAPATVTVKLTGQDGERSREVELTRSDRWQEVDVSWQDLGFGSAERFQGALALEFAAPDAPAGVYVDDVTFRRPARRTYEIVKLIHCGLPTLAGLIVGALLLALLSFDETRDVARWVKRRGWRRRGAQVEAAPDGQQ